MGCRRRSTPIAPTGPSTRPRRAPLSIASASPSSAAPSSSWASSTSSATPHRPAAAANRYLQERFIPDYNARFGRRPADPASAFVPVGGHDLDQILCHEEERVVARDNTVTLDRLVLQIPKQRGRRSCAGLRVLVRRHLDGQYSVWWGPR